MGDHLPATAAFQWLALGWRDLWNRPIPSLLYGLGIALLSLLVIAAINVGCLLLARVLDTPELPQRIRALSGPALGELIALTESGALRAFRIERD